ncbi:hypothetical protein ES319_A10G171700v1 [Gossypium barbadense]|uniref:ribulose-phosphate 3-epimerase n=2 Tax=Gossypium TaxID=3633 RepID=A0A5J5U4P8_GOSBA|nr:hypothetical protein ES319_A10G171700v1 [Gossypium barbadense]TYG99390.1 hypothetical protein ES288_A10G191800v1 [Gossypium darwinii]
MGVTPKIAPSMLASDFANLASEAKRMLDFGADWLHMDIMDGYVSLLSWTSLLKDFASLSFYFFSTSCFSHFHRHFVPNLTIGAPVIESLRKQTKAFLDCHLMVTNPIDYVEPLGKAGASGFTFHVEVSKENWQELIQKIKSKAMRPGVALKPGTPIEEVYPLVDSENLVEMVLVMTVEPGFGGQKFMPEMVDKVRVLRKKYPALDIENVSIQISDTARKMKCWSNIHGHSCLLKKLWV